MSDLDDRPVSRRLAAYSLLTFTLSWGSWGIGSLLAARTPVDFTVFFVLGAFGPSVAAVALIVTGRDDLRTWLRAVFEFRLRGRYYVLALLLPVGAVLVAGVVHVLVFGGDVAVDALPPLVAYPLYLGVVLFFFGGQEEVGWRGFLLPLLQERYSALGAALLVGVVWAVWHLPLFFVPGTIQGELPLWLYVPEVVALSIVLTWITNSASGSVLPAMLLHAGANAMVNYYPAGGATEAVTPLGFGLLTSVLVVLACAIGVYYGPQTLAWTGKPTTLVEQHR